MTQQDKALEKEVKTWMKKLQKEYGGVHLDKAIYTQEQVADILSKALASQREEFEKKESELDQRIWILENGMEKHKKQLAEKDEEIKRLKE